MAAATERVIPDGCAVPHVPRAEGQTKGEKGDFRGIYKYVFVTYASHVDVYSARVMCRPTIYIPGIDDTTRNRFIINWVMTTTTIYIYILFIPSLYGLYQIEGILYRHE